jgi:heat shock protein HtpX
MFAWGKRIILFLLVNILVLTTVSIVFSIITSVFQIPVNATWLLFYALIGFGGAFISLAMSRAMAKWMMGVKVLDPKTLNPAHRKLIDMVHRNARLAGLKTMPEVGIFDSPEVNAFATGPTKNRALVAVSTGLLNTMGDDAVEGVIGHEISHISNGDMVTMTLLQGLINTLVLILARLIAQVIAGAVQEKARPMVAWITFQVLQMALSVLGFLVVAYFSRKREYRADAGGARLAGRDKMLAGLRSLRQVYGHVDDEQRALATLKISGHPGHLFSTHPPLEERIRALETQAL